MLQQTCPAYDFTDCLVLLSISKFLPDPGDVVHFDVIFPLIKVRGWSRK